jgi:gluconate 5-dehydrogenase
MSTSLFSLAGRKALVTGSSRGIGQALAVGLAGVGAAVAVHGRTLESAEAGLAAVAAAAAAAGAPEPVAVGFDVTDATAVDAAVADLDARLGGLDVLVANVGVQHREPLVDVPLDQIERLISVNLTSMIVVCRAAARHMLPRGRGKIVTIGSVQSELARPNIATYTATKGAVRNLTRAMCAEWAGSGLSVNCLAPGYIVTELTSALVAEPAFDAWVRGRTPEGRWGRVEDLVGTCVYLAAPASDFVNGQTLHVDGGMTVVV